MKIGSVDPGGRTGLIKIETRQLVIIGGRGFGKADRSALAVIKDAMQHDRFIGCNIHGTELEQAQELYRRLRAFDVVIIEDWQIPAKISTRKHEALSPVRIGFGLALLLTMSPRFKGKIVWQQPTQMGVITDDRLRQWGLWLPGQENKDIRSAMKHLIIYLRSSAFG